MRRPFVISTGALALALLPRPLFAQTPAPQPRHQQPAAHGAGRARRAEARVREPAGMLLVHQAGSDGRVRRVRAKLAGGVWPRPKTRR